MSTSTNFGKEVTDKYILDRGDIKTIIDVGPGRGTYARNIKQHSSQHTWIGIEIWEPYIKDFQLNKWYNKIIVGDIRNVEFPQGDLVIFGDVLEHLEKDDALRVLRRALPLFRHVIVAIPLGEMKQERVTGNIYETHRSIWSQADLEAVCSWDIICRYKFTEESHYGIFIRKT